MSDPHDKTLTLTEYGIYSLSASRLDAFLKAHRIRARNILARFQKDQALYLQSLQEGVWVPLVPVQAAKCIVKLQNQDESFSQEWEKRCHYEGFNLEIGEKGDLWIGSLGALLEYDAQSFVGPEQSYETLDGHCLYNGFHYHVPAGKYLLDVTGFDRKSEKEFPHANRGYAFRLRTVEQFDAGNDPRDDSHYIF